MSKETSKPGVLRGLQCLFGGLFQLVTTPSYWFLALVPIGLFLAMWLLLGWAMTDWISNGIGTWLGSPPGNVGGIWVGLVKFLASALMLVVAGFFAMPLSQFFSGSALEALVRRQESHLGAPERPSTPVLQDMVQSLASFMMGTALALPPAALLGAIGFFFPPSLIVVVPLQFLLAAFVIAWDVCDLPLSLRGLPAKERLAWFSKHKRAVFGFGVGLAACNLIPGLLFLMLPAAVLGATRLTWSIEQTLQRDRV